MPDRNPAAQQSPAVPRCAILSVESDDALLRMPFKEARAAAIDAFEERYVLHLLERTQHNASKAARLAGIDRNYLYRMMKKHGIARKE